MNKSSQLATESIVPLFFKLAIPTIAAQIVNLLYNIVDRIYIGNIEGVGFLALTGLGLCFPIIIIITAFCSLFGAGGAPKAAIAIGEGDIAKAEKIMGNCFVCLIGTAVVLTIVFSIFSEDLLYLFGASSDTIGYAKSYLDIYILGSICVLITTGMNYFITAQGFTKISMATIMIGAVLNIVLDPIFIFVFGMGVQGAALATIISQAVSAIWVVKFLVGKKAILKLKLSNFALDPKIVLSVMALGVSPFVMSSTESILNISFNVSLANYGGDLAVGTMTILSSVMQFCTLPLQGMAQGAQPIISFNYGARNFDRVKKAFKILLITALIYTSIYWIVIMTSADSIVRIFGNDTALNEMAAWALRIYLGGSILLGAQFACQNTFLALNQPKISLFLACLRKLVLLIPLIFILPNFFEDKVFAVFLAEPVSDAIASLVTLACFILLFPKIMKKAKANL